MIPRSTQVLSPESTNPSTIRSRRGLLARAGALTSVLALSTAGMAASAAHAVEETPAPAPAATVVDVASDSSGIDRNAAVTAVPGTVNEPGSISGIESSVAPGLYQTAYSPSRNSLYVTSAVGRPPVSQSSLIKLDADTLAYQNHAVPEIDPTAIAREGKPLEGARYAVYGVAVDDERGTVWVTNTRQNTVAVYDADTLKLIKQFDKDIVPHSRDVVIDAARDRAYVSSARSNKIAVFDTSTNTQLADITVGQDADDFSAMSLSFDEASGTLVTVSASSAKAAIIDVASGSATEVPLPAGVARASGVAYNPATGRIYIASQGSGDLVVVEKDGTVVNQVVTATVLKDADEHSTWHSTRSTRWSTSPTATPAPSPCTTLTVPSGRPSTPDATLTTSSSTDGGTSTPSTRAAAAMAAPRTTMSSASLSLPGHRPAPPRTAPVRPRPASRIPVVRLPIQRVAASATARAVPPLR